VSYYYPGYKAGGALRTIENMVSTLGDRLEFHIVTSDRDYGDIEAYQGVNLNHWNRIGKGFVFYLPSNTFKYYYIFKLIKKNCNSEVIYFNSFFNINFTIYPLLICKLLNFKARIIVAPRGEFSNGALSFNFFKKNLFIKIMKISRLFKNVNWQASSQIEKDEIISIMGVSGEQVKIASDLTNSDFKYRNGLTLKHKKKNNALKIIFISRIKRKKNLHFLLMVLSMISTSKVQLNIYGPIEDTIYWDECTKIINSLSQNITVHFHGVVARIALEEVFTENDLFIFPTLSENFGHVIFESLSFGVPVVISDQTPWSFYQTKAIECLPLSNIELWVNAIHKYINMDNVKYSEISVLASEFAYSYQKNNCDLIDNINLFECTR